MTFNFHSIIPRYPSSATFSALAVFEKKLVLSIPEIAPNSVAVAPGRSVVTLMLVSYSSSFNALEKDVTYAFVA